ncbi:MAG: hypothetical protein JO323_02285 [Acidobacteriia bacterium]|nr:hypothetical protein [Terriglobia bacterium]
MASYISSNANRFYTALESGYGSVPTPTANNRIPALKLTVQQQLEVTQRKDKTGSRTFVGLPTGGRRRTNFELHTYLTNWNKSNSPAYGALFQSALGGAPLQYVGGTLSSSDGSGRLGFASPHGLSLGQAVSSGGDVRFVAAIVDANTIQLNAPFTVIPGPGAPIGATITYAPATELPSVTIFDYWDPSTAVQRLVAGAAVDQMDILVNGDYHEFHFRGLAQDVIDTSSFTAGGLSQLQSFPVEPPITSFDYTIIPGNLGQAWLGTSPTQFFTITNASIQIKNALDTRTKEFGSSLPRAISPGQRSVTATFSLYGLNDTATASLYQAARQQSPVTVMFQLGEANGSMMAVNLKSVIPEVPEFDDSSNRLQWKFRASRAQGTINDEITIALA